jgi:hypothetical protein
MPKVDFENRIIDIDSKLFVTATTSLRHAATPVATAQNKFLRILTFTHRPPRVWHTEQWMTGRRSDLQRSVAGLAVKNKNVTNEAVSLLKIDHFCFPYLLKAVRLLKTSKLSG